MAEKAKTWWVDRAREPSTYQGLSVLAGLLGSWLFKDAGVGQDVLNAGLAVAAAVQVGKAEAVQGRDF